ncbi:rRNA methyltransferase 1, mitochondrial [Salminus brasiliensis]|uniref:rRNA methyltransferase 1, mitochondrial n=1 Tax=Salminus brasiliensis TaxID=930266 RepID=UPI003B835DB4
MWNLFQWRTACRCSRLIGNNRYFPKEGLLTVLCSGGPRYSSYQPSRTVLRPKDTVFKRAEQQKCHFITSLCNLSRSPNFAFAKKLKAKEPTAPYPAGRVSSEIQKLSLEDLTEADLQKLHKGSLKVKAPQVHRRGGKEHDMVFGVAPCLLALSQARRKAFLLFVKTTEGGRREAVQKVCEEAHRCGVVIQEVSKRELDKMTGGMVHQGVCLRASPLRFVTEETSARHQYGGHPNPLWLVLDGVQDPMNLGSILRCAYFLGVDRVASSIQNSCPLTPVVSKASSGVMELMDVFGYNNLAGIIKAKLEQGWQVIGTVGSKENTPGVSVVPCSDFKITKPTLLLMGGEGFGLSSELCQLCDVLLTIPPRRDLHPAVDSLNVSVATGILLHTLLSSRGGH